MQANPIYTKTYLKVLNINPIVSDKLDKNADKFFDNLHSNVEKKLNKLGIDNEPKGFIEKTVVKAIDQVEKLSKTLIGEQKNDVQKFAQECIKHVGNIFKSIFSNIGAMVNGEKKPSKAIEDIKKTCTEAGTKIAQAAGKLKTSFVEKVGGKIDKAASFVERLSKESTDHGKRR